MKIEETIEKTLLQQASEKLLKAQREIDELAVQLALGRAEGRDTFEVIKKEFSQQVKQLKDLLVKSPEYIKNSELKTKLESLELQLTLGKADSKEQFEEQKRKIIDALGALESKIKTQWLKIQAPDFFTHEVETFVLKLEILRLRFMLKKFEVKDNYRNKMAAVRTEISNLSSGVKDTLGKGKEKYHDFKDEVSLAYKHLRKAVESLS